MKLKEWADRTGVKYLTAYRWFKAGTLPVKAYQTDSGTIIVDDPDFSEPAMNVPNDDVMKLFLKKTVEFSKNNSSVEDFAAYVLSNFTLKSNAVSESPKYSKNKPKPEDIQNHFKQFLKPKGEKPKPNMFVAPEAVLDDLVSKADDMTTQELVSEIQRIGSSADMPVDVNSVPEVQDLYKDLSNVLTSPTSSSVRVYGDSAEGVVTRSVDLTPQLNYTSSNSSAFGSLTSDCAINSDSSFLGGTTHEWSPPSALSTPTAASVFFNSSGATGAFKPTQKEIESASRSLESPRARRGRKSHKKDKL